MSEIPEEGWPALPVLAPYETPGVPEFAGEIINCQDEGQVEEVIEFYKNFLVPQLACAPNGESDPHPQKNWLMSSESTRYIVLVRSEEEIHGAWVIRNNGIYYPCARPDFIAAVFRALWDETIKHFDYVWGDTRNAVIMAFAKKAIRVPRSVNSPTVTDEKLEWRRPQ